MALRLTVPIFDGGSIGAEVNKERKEMEKVKEEERALRLNISREIKDALLAIETADKRVEVTGKSIASARENLRVELLKYETCAGTSTDVIDAQTALLRSWTDNYQGIYDKNIAITSPKKALGEDLYGVEGDR